MGTKPALVQIRSSDKEKYLNLQEEIEDIHLDTELLYDDVDELNRKVNLNTLKKTAVFYVSRIRQPNHFVSLFVPLTGAMIKMYVNLGRASVEDLNVKLTDVSGTELGNITIPAGNVLAESILDQRVDYQVLKVIVNGEMLLPDVSVSIDIATDGDQEQ